MLHILRQLGRFLVHVLRRFSQDRCFQIGSTLTFTTLIALVPLVTIVLTLICGRFLERFAAIADDALNQPLKRLLEIETA